MRIAVLILAHKNLPQLDRLLQRLTTDFDVYLHLDKKWNIDISQFETFRNLTLVERHTVNWGSYKQIQAAIELFLAAFKNDYDFYLMISGQDVPIKSNAYIIEFLANNTNHSFIDYEQFPKKAWVQHFEGGYTRLKYYYGMDFKRNAIGFVFKKGLAFVRMLQKLTYITRKLKPIKYYGGWCWVNVNRPAMNYLLNFINYNPGFLKSFKYTFCGDEVWLQTIVMNSPNDIINNDLRYTDWSGCLENPKTLTIAHLDELMSSNALFARKFDTDVDAKVIDIIYHLTN